MGGVGASVYVVGASVYVVAPKIIASAPVPFGPFGPFWGWNWVGLGWDWVWGDWGLRGWGLGLDNNAQSFEFQNPTQDSAAYVKYKNVALNCVN